MSKVTLHVYDVGKDSKVGALNEYLQAMGTGAFHGGVEINDVEWSYGYSPDGTGVFCNKPKACGMHVFRESVDMGTTTMTPDEVGTLLLQLKATWPGFEYDLLRHNCVIFSSFFCEQLGCGAAPAWITNLAGAGATLSDGFTSAQQTIGPLAIIAAAKAGEINAQYDVSGKANAGAKSVMLAAGNFDEEYKVREKAFAAGARAKATGQALAAEADDDGDGQVSIAEMQDFFREKAEKTPDFLQSKAWEMKEGASAMAAALQKAADKDGDGQVSFAEAADHLRLKAQQFDSDYAVKDKVRAAAAAAAAQGAAAAAALQAKGSEHFKAADKNKDGTVDAAEAKAYAAEQASKCGCSQEQCQLCTVQ